MLKIDSTLRVLPILCLSILAVACQRNGTNSTNLTSIDPSRAAFVPGVSSVITQHNDNARSGANLKETQLNTGNVNPAQFGKLFARQVEGDIYAQPLYLPSVAIAGKGTHNVVYVATQANNVYAFDADDAAQEAPLWQVNLGPSIQLPIAACGSAAADPDECDFGTAYGSYHDIQEQIGIISTPVINPATNTMYLVNTTHPDRKTFKHFLHAIDITTGAEKLGGPTEIQASVPGTGDGSVNGVLKFDSKRELQRVGLLLQNNSIIFAFAGYADTAPFHGWIMSYNASTLSQEAAFSTSPDSDDGGIWQSGNGLAADADGAIYAVTGNAQYDVNKGGKSFGDSAMKLNLSANGFAVTDWFTPSNWEQLEEYDLDVGSSGIVLIPGTGLAAFGSKEGKIYIVNRANMGRLHVDSAGNPIYNDNQIIQTFQATDPNSPDHNIHGAPVIWDSPTGKYLYVWGEEDRLKAFKFISETQGFDPTPISSPTAAPGGMPGGIISISANGSTAGTGIVWGVHAYSDDANPATVEGVLEAYDASDITKRIWSSKTNQARDNNYTFAKFQAPTIVDGKVFIGNFNGQLLVYGLLPTPAQNRTDFNGPLKTLLSFNRCLGIRGNAPTSGAALELQDCTSTGMQSIHYIASTGQLKVFNDSMCIASGGVQGSAVTIAACANGANQQWQVDTGTGIFAGLNNLCLNVSGNNNGYGANVIVWACDALANNERFAAPTLTAPVGTPVATPTPVPTPAPTPVPPSTPTPTPGSTGGDIVGSIRTQLPGNRCIDIAGVNKNPGAYVELYDCMAQTNQNFHFVSATGQIKVYQDSMCLAINGAGVAGDPISIANCSTTDPRQKWAFDAAGRIAGMNNLCIDVSGVNPAAGTALLAWTCHTGTNQMWTTNAATTTVPTAGEFNGAIRTQLAGNRCMDVAGYAQNDGAKLEIWDCVAQANQAFHFVPSTGQIKVYQDAKCLTINGSGVAGDPISIATCSTTDARQKWSMDASGRIAGMNGLCVDVSGANAAAGTALLAWTCHGDANQKWLLP